MKTKKSLGILAGGLFVCAALVFNFVIFPKVLAASPGNRDVETLTPESTLLSMPTEQSNETELPEEAVPNINAISEEQAIEIANSVTTYPIGESTKRYDNDSFQTVKTTLYDTRYLDSTDPASDPAWFVLFENRVVGEKYEYIPDSTTPEAYLKAHQDSPSPGNNWSCRLGTDKEGTTVVILATDWTTYAIVEVNALTGESVYYGDVGSEGTGVEKAFYGDDIRQNLVREVIPEPAN